MNRIKVAILGMGNCASSLIQGIHYYREHKEEHPIGLMHREIGGYSPADIEVVSAWDIDRRKVGRDVAEAIFAKPNCAQLLYPHVPEQGVIVEQGRLLDGLSEHMLDYDEDNTFLPSPEPEPEREEVVRQLKQSGAQMLLNYLPVGAEEASRFYADCALQAGLGLINNIPVFLASDSLWAERFSSAGLPVIGDDIKSQLGATIVHRVLAELFSQRGVQLSRTYQLNIGGNTDFLNMLNRHRLTSKKKSKTEAVRSIAGQELGESAVHVGPSDFVPWQEDSKTAFIRMEGKIFGDAPVSLDLKLSVQDSPNSAGSAIDAIRCLKIALERGEAGPLLGPSSFFMKHPPRQYSDERARRETEAFIQGDDCS